MSPFRALRGVLRLASTVMREAGRTEASRQVAFELATLEPDIRGMALAVLARLGAKGWNLPSVADVTDALNRLPRPTWGGTARRVFNRAVSRREGLPVEAARAVPLDTVAERVGLTLHRRGRVVTACCPFHDDKRPSLTFDLRKGVWFCHPCQRGGDGIELLMRVRGLSFAHAVRELAA